MLCLLLSATFVDSGSVLTNGVVNNNICWFCTVEQNVDSRMDPNRQIVSPKTRETTNYTVGYLLTHQQVCWSTRWVQQPDCSFCAHFNKWCCPESTKCGAPTASVKPASGSLALLLDLQTSWQMCSFNALVSLVVLTIRILSDFCRCRYIDTFQKYQYG